MAEGLTLSGWLKLWRVWRDAPVSRDANAWLVMTHCLTTARFRQTWNDLFGYVLEPGETDVTNSQLVDATGLSLKEVRGALSRMEHRFDTITTRTVRGSLKGINRRIITFCNWKAYQGDELDQGITSLDGSTDYQKQGIKSGITRQDATPEHTMTSVDSGSGQGVTDGIGRASKGQRYKKDQKEEQSDSQVGRNEWEDPDPLNFDD